MTSSSHEREVPRVWFLTGASFRMRSELAPQTLAAGAGCCVLTLRREVWPCAKQPGHGSLNSGSNCGATVRRECRIVAGLFVATNNPSPRPRGGFNRK